MQTGTSIELLLLFVYASVMTLLTARVLSHGRYSQNRSLITTLMFFIHFSLPIFSAFILLFLRKRNQLPESVT